MSEWQKIRQEVLRRDNRICQVCGKEHSGQVHHILPRSQGGTNDLANLITLCGKCHMVISPVPEWLITKLWQIPAVEISPASQAIQDKIEQVVKQRQAEK
ncbi:HNH endonuclease [Scytonema millei]|uniref:HNH endonuclease n=1 Tax=Scytonema millei VB511283 TaxID=1245923 RepID=A0A9X5E2P2_9CYAN|nr:HNH endonuclease [Scytonema millei]NHC33969.1 HNH endonuclease [Scytonema millei VB511283]